MPLQLGPDSEKKELWEEVQRLRRELERRDAELEKTRKRFEDYKKRHPDKVGVKNGKAYEIKPSPQPSADPPTQKRRPGGQIGHPGHHRARPERIDGTIRIRIRACPDCHGKLSRVQEQRTRIVEDIPKVEALVTEYQIDRRYCKNCERLVEGQVEAALPGATIGLRAMLAVAWLRYGCRVPQEVVPDLVATLLGLRISTGEVQGILDQLARAYGPVYERVIEDLRNRRVVNGDETSWRISGENPWLWVFITRWETVYHIAQGRGHEVALDVLGEDFRGVMVSDRHGAYRKFASKSGAAQQHCWAHIIADAKELAEWFPKEGNRVLRSLKAVYAHAVNLAPGGSDEDVSLLVDALVTALGHPYESNHVARFARNVLKDPDSLFRFVVDPEVDSTNNRAERALRPMVVARKVSGGSRSKGGARVRAVVSSLLRTMDQRKVSLLDEGPRALLASPG